jgi:sugar lactone lactonase YvrE
MKVRIKSVSGLFLLMAGCIWSQHVVTLPADLAAPGVAVESVLEGLAYSEGPTFDPDGNLYFSEDPDVQTGRIWKITPGGEKTKFKDPSRGANGLEMDNQGRLHICMLDSVLRIETDGKVTVLAAKSGTLNLARVNDITLSSTGAMFFSNLNGNSVFYRSPDGQIKTKTVAGANGVEWIEEKGFIYIGGNTLQKCPVNATTGEIGTCTKFANAADGITTDVNGNVYRAAWQEGKIYVHDSTGKELGNIAIAAAEVTGKSFSKGAQGNTSNCAFGGPDRKTLYITGDGGCYRVQLKVAGRLRPGAGGTAIRSYFSRTPNTGKVAARPFAATLPGVYFLDAKNRVITVEGKTQRNLSGTAFGE